MNIPFRAREGCAAQGDWRGLPSPETLEAAQGVTLLHTDRNGWIVLTTNADQMLVEDENQ